MLKRVCDKCRREIDGRYFSLGWAENGGGFREVSPCADLCSECEKEFWKWLKGEEMNDREGTERED